MIAYLVSFCRDRCPHLSVLQWFYAVRWRHRTLLFSKPSSTLVILSEVKGRRNIPRHYSVMRDINPLGICDMFRWNAIYLRCDISPSVMIFIGMSGTPSPTNTWLVSSCRVQHLWCTAGCFVWFDVLTKRAVVKPWEKFRQGITLSAATPLFLQQI